LSGTTGCSSWRLGVSISAAHPDPRARDVSFGDDEFSVALSDGRKIVVPLAWFPRLLNATPDQRENWRLLGQGTGIHWPDVDEDISVEGLLQGRRSFEYGR
jgi:hypothetical protein